MFTAQSCALRVVYNILKVFICTVAYAGIVVSFTIEITKIDRVCNVISAVIH